MKTFARILAAFLFLLPAAALAQNTATKVVGIGTSGTPAGGTLSVDCVSGCSAAPTTTPVSSAALVANQVISASPAKLASFDISADSTLSGAAWWVMIYNATSAPADGAVTPAKCYAVPSGATSIFAAFPAPPSFSTGIVIGVSTTGCFTKTASTHAFISGDFQ